MPDQTMIDQHLQNVQEEMRDIRGMLAKMAEALTKLSVLEERNLASNQVIEKIALRMDKMDERINTVVLDHAKFEANINGMSTAIKVMWAICGTGILVVGGQIIKHFAN